MLSVSQSDQHRTNMTRDGMVSGEAYRVKREKEARGGYHPL